MDYETIRQDITAEELQKSWALHMHNTAIQDMKIYNLPYAIMLDYLELGIPEDESKITYISKYYPFRECPKPGRWEWWQYYTSEEWLKITTQDTGKRTADGKKIVDIFVVPPQIQALIDEKGKPFRMWDLETAAGLKGWLYYFMFFIMPYAEEIPGFSCFDMFGDVQHTTKELEAKKEYYLKKIEQCKLDPTLYRHDIEKRSDPLTILYSERDKIPGYETERKDETTRAHRIESVIQLLEQYNANNKPKNGDKTV